MNFGSLQIVTAWRLAKDGVVCQAIVMDGTDGVRLVVIENQQIVEWIRFGRIFELRQYVSTAFKARQRAGWLPCGTPTPEEPATTESRTLPRARRRAAAQGLFDHR